MGGWEISFYIAKSLFNYKEGSVEGGWVVMQGRRSWTDGRWRDVSVETGDEEDAVERGWRMDDHYIR